MYVRITGWLQNANKTKLRYHDFFVLKTGILKLAVGNHNSLIIKKTTLDLIDNPITTESYSKIKYWVENSTIIEALIYTK